MPELPEVETVRNTLKHFVLNQKIENVEVFYDSIITGDTSEFKSSVSNNRIVDIQRKGKYLIFILDDCAFVSHLRMEGKYHIVEKGNYPKHTHVVFHLEHQDLIYIDVRKFGRMQLVDKEHYLLQSPLNKLGDEPKDIDIDTLYFKLHSLNTPIKTTLLDQSIMCGIGNIYADEIVYRMQCDPRTRSSKLSKNRVLELKKHATDVLNEAILQGGTTIRSFDSNGIHGLFQVSLNVHTQKTCKVCHTDIKKITLNGRGTYYCPKCQKKRY